MDTGNTLEMRISAIEKVGLGILSYEFVPVAGGELPAFTAGAHVDVHLPGSMVRSYSLYNSQNERHRYVIAVALDAKSRGGSKHMHEHLKVGDVLKVGKPRNDFPVSEAAA